jgi:hypothetical protein
VLTVRYEDIVLEFESTIKRILEFTGDAIIESVYDWHRLTHIREHGAWFGPVEPLNPAGIGRWQKFLDSEIIRHFLDNDSATKLLSELGYL